MPSVKELGAAPFVFLRKKEADAWDRGQCPKCGCNPVNPLELKRLCPEGRREASGRIQAGSRDRSFQENQERDERAGVIGSPRGDS